MSAGAEFTDVRMTASQTNWEKALELMSVERFDLAERVLREALVARPDFAPAHALLGRVCYRLNRTDEARSEAQTALGIDPLDTGSLQLLSCLERDAGRNQLAERLLLDALRIDPQDPRLLLSYAGLMHRTNHLEKAEKLVRSALRLDPNDENGHALLANIQSERAQSRGAIKSARQSVVLRPDSDVPHLAMGIAYYQHGRPFSARRHLREAVRIDPTDADARDLYHEIDGNCRWLMLPMYYLRMLFQRIPGGQYTVWGILMLGNFAFRNGPMREVWFGVAMSWLLICLYSFIASPLTSAWIKLFPAK